jgi:hydrogenase maturation factor
MKPKRTIKEIPEDAKSVVRSARKAVRLELIKKAKLGQYAIVDLGDGKPSRVLASELIKNFK